MKCELNESRVLKNKGISAILSCWLRKPVYIRDLEQLKVQIQQVFDRLLSLNRGFQILFSENEPIGTKFMIHKFHLFVDGDFCSSIRVITRDSKFVAFVSTFSDKCYSYISKYFDRNTSLEPKIEKIDADADSNAAPGQKYIPYFVIYRILGQPSVDLNTWRLSLRGLVKNEINLSYEQLRSMPQQKLISDFHCVTGWSVKNREWEGIEASYLADLASVKSEAKWVFIKSLDGYTTVLPVEDFLSDDSLLVLKLDGKILSYEQGFPVRLFIAHLYGWKGAKWVEEITFTDKYADGYWEALGYHERGNVFLEERFKKKL